MSLGDGEWALEVHTDLIRNINDLIRRLGPDRSHWPDHRRRLVAEVERIHPLRLAYFKRCGICMSRWPRLDGFRYPANLLPPAPTRLGVLTPWQSLVAIFRAPWSA